MRLADKKPFSESRKPVSLLLVVASLCLGMRLVTELTVYAEGRTVPTGSAEIVLGMTYGMMNTS